MRSVVRKAWALEDMNAQYAGFITRFENIGDHGHNWENISGKTAFILRTLLIHDYRRLLLRDPHLPEELLPQNWQGSRARNLCATLYRHLAGPANAYIYEKFEVDLLTKPALNPLYTQRFGGLADI